MKRAMLMAAALWTLSVGTAWSIDTVFTSTSQKPYFGKIVSMSSAVINFQPTGIGPTEIPANEITRITFENSPETLTAAQKDILEGRYQEAIDALKKEVPEGYRKEVADEIIFCRAYSTAQLAITGAIEASQAAAQMAAFIANSPNNFHYFKACELMGDLCVELGRFADAQKYYAKLSETPWADFKIRAQVALGRSYLAQDNAAKAEKAFDDALDSPATGDLAEIQRIAARIGKARCLVLAGNTDQALSTLNEVLDRADDKNSGLAKNPEISAMAYNALGTALRKAGKPKDAIRAFLHVHLYYSTLPDPDAEAVANLERLFTEDHKLVHQREMRSLLDDKYRNSRWAKGVK